MKSVAILGCGPAGLMAAQAAESLGYEPVIFSKPVKSVLGGAQFLHMPIPGINDEPPDALITYRVIGNVEDYQRKVYGGATTVPFVSMASVWDGKEQPAWNLIKTYERLWIKFIDRIHPTDIDTHRVEALLANKSFSHVFNTVPLISICKARAGLMNEVHHFHSQEVLIHTDPYIEDIEDNTVIYNGDLGRSWYRASRIFGVDGCEWSALSTKPMVPVIHDHKPIMTTCTCWPDMVRLGRRGTWKKGVLTHDAYIGVVKVLG